MMRTAISVFLIIIFLFSLSSGQIFPDVDQIRQKIREFEAERFQRQLPYLTKAPTTNQTQFDVNFYTLNLSLWPATELLEGSVIIQGKSLVNGLSHIEIDLFDNMVVDSVLQDNNLLPYTHGGDLITIQLASPLNSGDFFTVEIFYYGNPQGGGLGTWGWDQHSGVPIIWTLSEPFGAPAWWPCKDDPSDKADSVFLNITVPIDLVVGSNGLLKAITPVGTTRHTYSWETRYPISTYLVSLAITNYAEFGDWYVTVTGDSMPLQFFVYPEHLAAAQQDFSVTKYMIEAFAPLFGEYPFLNEKYGMAIFPWGGAMEHQTLTSYGANLITGNNYYDWINAHELSHQWFGDCITMRRWSHIWLNEGFASYAEALWTESLYGLSGYHSYINSQDPGSFQGSLFVYDSTNVSALFSNTVYDKGSWVLHMLRGVLGDSLFFTGLKHYATHPAFMYGNAVTEDLRDAFEEATGWELDWYFDQWVYRPGRPNYVYNWQTTSGSESYTTTLNIYQSNPIPYKMPLQIKLSASGFDTLFTVWDSLANQTFQFVTDFQPTNLQIDPNRWVLKNVTSGNFYFAVGQVIDIGDSSGIPYAEVYWEGPYDPTTGQPQSWGVEPTDEFGHFQLSLLQGDYAFVAVKDSFLQSEAVFKSINTNISGLLLALSQPQESIYPDSIGIVLHQNETVDTTLTIENIGTGNLFVQAVEGKFETVSSPAFTPPLLAKQIDLTALQQTGSPPFLPQSGRFPQAKDPVDSLWQWIHHDAQENPQNIYDIENTYVQKDGNMFYVKFTTYQQPTLYHFLRINLFLDTDDDAQTGLNIMGMGTDYLIAIGNLGAGFFGYVLKWNPNTLNFDFIGFSDYFSANPQTRSVVVGQDLTSWGNPTKINLYYPAFDATNLTQTIDYVPASNLGYLSANLDDMSLLAISPLFDLANADSSAQFRITINPATITPGFYKSGITLHLTHPGEMRRVVVPIYLDYITSVSNQDHLLPKQFAVSPNYPNPFNPTTTIAYPLPYPAHVSISIFNTLGQKVHTLLETSKPAGYYHTTWDARNFPSGVYFFRVVFFDEASRKILFSQTSKMLFVK
ncbi:MAG: hypothetical protein Kow0042_11560 [Calditrichia bacterium]